MIRTFIKLGGARLLQIDEESGNYLEQSIHGVEELGNVEVTETTGTFIAGAIEGYVTVQGYGGGNWLEIKI